MPPALTDSEDEITFETMTHVSAKKDKKNGIKAKEESAGEEEVLNLESADEKEEEKDDDEEAEDIFTVEKIITHRFDTDGTLLFNIKWEGYEKVADRTWEPEDNLNTAKELVEEYFDSLGGREKVLFSRGKKATTKRGRKSDVAPASTKKAKTEKKTVSRSVTPKAVEEKFTPPSGSWEDEIKAIDAAEGAEGQVQVYLTWRNGQKTQHPLETCYKRCPQKMLKFFESHLVMITLRRRRSRPMELRLTGRRFSRRHRHLHKKVF